MNSETPQAAVLVPLCNVEGKPSILFEVRGNLRSHAGEVSFPGGKRDPDDKSLMDTALRETQEEIGLVPEQVEILGELGPPELSLRGLRVSPFVGFVHSSPHYGISPQSLDRPLASLCLESLVLNTTEVAQVFHLPVQMLKEQRRLREHLFRDLHPYWAVDVTDRVGSGDQVRSRLEIWGLTGWYLNLLMRSVAG
ncbi:hypothetical protein SISSUDRAFT_986927 [Sistotremastrum suecicum HHB10207 ss-3]|uniref:Nudix hydrolase domain-containing protein n=1 Tax=Sistotremastrum suecicum HHB10207 ss-3 TaxID=1314776 RepID=A0A166CYA6_9AGAM|nr:hypothetical protein SISSUDRAFT_986927 [Sistotremastrum suecicum HHB10207 ss-3]